MATTTTIAASVGSGGRNNARDVKVIQLLLNNWQRSQSQTPLNVDGLVGPKTIGAIKAFQKSFGGVVDGRADPGGPTVKRLLALQATLLTQGVPPHIATIARTKLASHQEFVTSGRTVDFAAALDALLRAASK